MSEDSKMGLFGSKDETKESTTPADETTKETSPDSFAPYCIDSDSETYDTEALSIMDINDIIGVQAGSAAESTLESEIAALSEIITDSKDELSFDAANKTPGESMENKLNQRVLTEFNSSISENLVPSTSEESCKQDQVEDVREKTKDISIKFSDPSSSHLSQIKEGNGSGDEADTKVALKLSEQINTELKLESESKGESLLRSSGIDSKTATTAGDELCCLKTDDVGIKLNLENESTKNDVDSAKCENVAIAAVQNPVKDVDLVPRLKAAKEKVVDNFTDEKLGDVLTNVGSTSKSLQLIGEAYISEDSQEIDETDESPVVKVDAVSLPDIEERKTSEEDVELEEKSHFNDLSTDTPNNQPNVTVAADNKSEGVVEKIDLDNQSSVPLVDSSEPDNEKQDLANLCDSFTHCTDRNIKSHVNVEQKSSHVIDEDKSTCSNFDGKSSELVDSNTELDSSFIQETTVTRELPESEEEQNSAPLENITENLDGETIGVMPGDEVSEVETNLRREKLQDEVSERTELQQITVAALKDDDFCMAGSEEMLVKELESSSDVVSDIRVEMAEEKSAENIDEEHKSVLTEESPSIAQPPITELEISREDAKSSEAAEGLSTDSEDVNNPSSSPTSAGILLPETEKENKTLENVEEVLETVAETEKDRVIDDDGEREKTPLVVKDTDETENEINYTDNIVIANNEKLEEGINSEISEPLVDEFPQLETTKSTSIVAEVIGTDININDKEEPIPENNEAVEDVKNSETEFKQSESKIEDAPVSQITEVRQPEEELADKIEESNSPATEAEASPLQIVEEKLNEGKEDSVAMDTEEEIATESYPSFARNEEESETTSSNVTENVSESPAVDVVCKNVEIVEPDSKADDLNQQQTSEETVTPEEIDGSKNVNDGTPAESEILETDTEKIKETEVCEETKESQNNESINELSVDENETKVDDKSDRGNIEIDEDKSMTEASAEIPEESMNRGTPEVDTAQQDQLENESCADPQTTRQVDENEGKIQLVEHKDDDVNPEKSPELDAQLGSKKQEDESNLERLSHSDDVTPSAGSEPLPVPAVEAEKQDNSERRLRESVDEANSERLISNASDEITIDLPEDSSAKTRSVENEAKELGETITELVSRDDSKSSNVEEKLDEDKKLAAESSDDIGDGQSSEKNLETSEVSCDKHEAETLLNINPDVAPITLTSDDPIESNVRIEEDLQSESTKELENLTAEEKEETINKLADVLTEEIFISTVSNIEESENTSTINELLPEIKKQSTDHFETVDEKSVVQDSNEEPPSVSYDTSRVTDVTISSTNNDNGMRLTDNETGVEDNEKVVPVSLEDELKTGEDLISEDQNLTEIEEENVAINKNLEIILPLKEDEEKLMECSVFEECDTKIDLSNEELFETEDADQGDMLCGTTADNISQQSSEFSELECAVKFLQESEEQTIDSPLLLSPKIAEEIIEESSEQSKSCLFLSETEVCEVGNLELPVELEEITPDSIAISEAEIISEAAKLENERKLKIAEEMSKNSEIVEKFEATEETLLKNNPTMLQTLLTSSKVSNWSEKTCENLASTSEKCEMEKLTANIIRRSEKIPKISILEERLKEPPKIEIPMPEGSPKISDIPTTPKTSLLIQRDSRIDAKLMYQKMLESPKGGDKSESRIVDTPRKDSDKHDFENVGSPRIILKIAKSAIADCGEPRSPKSPKIRSAANSPNPEDSPGQKLGKIKLKLSRGGHPSIISNENVDESVQRHNEAILSPSHIGMKIKLSKTGDASIIQPEKHESIDETKDLKHRYEDHSPKRIESPLGMKIKLSKTGDPSIVQQESKESTPKRKEKLDIGQEIPKRTDSPIGMKIKLSKSGDASIIQPEKQESLEDNLYNDKFEIAKEIPKRTESPLGMKIKLSKTGDASIISTDSCEEFKDSSSKSRDKLNANQEIPKRTDSPLGMKFKLTKSGGASIIQPDKIEAFEDYKDKLENTVEITKRVESPIGMKIKLSKTGDASIIHPDKQESDEHKRTDSPIGMRIKVTKSGDASVVQSEDFKESLSAESFEVAHEVPKRNESPLGMKIKLSKSGDASIIHPERQELLDDSKDSSTGSSRGVTQEGSKSGECLLGMKIKLSKTGDASIIHRESSPESKRTESPLGMKIKLSKSGDASIIEPDKKEKSGFKQKEKSCNAQEVAQKRKDTEFPLEMKIKLSKTGHPTIVANEKQESLNEMNLKSTDNFESSQISYQKHSESTSVSRDSQLRIFKTSHSTIIQSNRSEVTIEPIQPGAPKPESSIDISQTSQDVVISPVDLKRTKLESKLSHMLPEVTIQPIKSGEQQQQQIKLDKKTSSISRQQMSVINQEISITQIPLSRPADLSMSGKLKEILRKNATNSPASSDCEIIEHRPELIIVNENSNSSQDIMIIEEVKAPMVEVKVPKKRGRPKRSTLPPGQTLVRPAYSQDPVSLTNLQLSTTAEHRESDRPKRTCRSQKSYAPPKRGRGRGRGKRKMDREECAVGKIPRLEDPLTAIERSTMSLIAPLQPRMMPEPTAQTSELYKALKQSPLDRKRLISETMVQHSFPDAHKKLRLEPEAVKQLAPNLPAVTNTDELTIVKTGLDTSDPKAAMISDMLNLSEPVNARQDNNEKLNESPKTEIQQNKSIISEMTTTEHQNWLTPSIKLPESNNKTEALSMVQVMDEETRMSAESNSRSQTPARNISIPAVETVINEESQGSVLSTATTESEKVKVRNRRMEINFDPDEGPFTVDKIAEYEWPLDKKGETFMIQEQISQYLGVKSFKRKYPDLKRRMVEMEERNFLRENILVSEGMCDMGLTAICSTEVLDIMCSDFPDQYEEYRKHMREKQAKEHSKKQKELTAAANAERNRIDLAEMAVQSALSWNVNFNKARKESRKYSLDLQSFTIHVPKKQQKVDAERKASNYPVALIPGQYTDYYREYTPAELRYYPLNTVLYGPMRPNERKFDSQSEGSQSDSDSDSSSDDSSSSSSEGTQDTEESQSTVDDIDMEVAANKEDNKNLKCKMCLRNLNKHGKAEVLIQCGTCNGNVHPSCIDLTLDMVPHIQGYSWQCTDCKTCVQCHNPADEDKMLFCDMCDRGYHIYCVGLRRVPQGRWHCRECAVCASCGLRQPGGANSDRNSVAQWQHEYKKGERNTRVYVSTLCVPCSKLWRKGRYCPHCSRCHSAQRLDLEPNLVHCGACDKYLHLGCVEIRSGTLDRKNYICECCSTPNYQLSRSLVSKTYRT